ncbi:HAD-IIA family hydrolase [Luteimicrobium subarcticum]|uniref:HAD superfamily hydrolase (TIGR01450 family)/HAD superfamily hydrolase (TIGR01549 family) n=1 Tax=Luteimicrobium subarcticum TaxID=620910 RepID=A0A2M8WWJ8_9MICO|nr:HAD-IIA family hydrolase [Luteimicrobium subarcticum]PJI95295.1 HAD superfamily hydrolase (TIGR01450 family)/HAD superfamily hydrolase (TIGR01549 family) [Luteimicrobium subarcticum]
MTTSTLRASTGPLAAQHDLALVDLDGVVYRGAHAVEHAPETLMRLRGAGLGLVFVTNNASREPGTVADQLSGLGLATRPDEVFTSAQAGAALLRRRLEPGARVLVVGGPGLRTAVREAGLVEVASSDEEPAAVVQGFSPDLSWADLAEASYAVARGAWHVATNRDLSIPTGRGTAPGNGTLVAAVVAATGVEPVSAGKPEPDMYRIAVDRAQASSPLVIGDRLDTDLAGARSAGYPGLLVLTGVHRVREAVLAVPGERPDYLGADLRALDDVHEVPEQRDGWWTLGGAAARVADGRLDLSGDPDVDLARCACVAAWAAVDAGEELDRDTAPTFAVRTD